MYAIVDIETTGGFAGGNRMTEIAVIIHDGNEIIHEYETLLNPMQEIPRYISGLTGITNQMVEEAPMFEDVADELFELLNDKVFVAHNVQFDYSFMKKAFEDAGYAYRSKKLCTVRLSRKAFPGHRSYSLGNLCESLRIPITDRHRAMGDAKATAIIFDRILKDNEDLIRETLNHRSRENILPPNLPREEFDALPEACGVYYFIDAHGKVIYVGKAINIRKRILGHFSGTSKGRRNQYMRNEVHHISFELTGNELIALVLEAQEIRRIWPKYNQAIKRPVIKWAIYQYEDREGYIRLQIGKQYRGMNSIASFNSHSEAWQSLLERVRDFELCPKLCGIQKSTGACYDLATGTCKGACDGIEEPEKYNERIRKSIESFSMKDLSFALIGQGRRFNEKSVLLVEDGTYSGFGYYLSDESQISEHEIREIIKPGQTSAEIEQYISTFVHHPDHEVVFLNSAGPS